MNKQSSSKNQVAAAKFVVAALIGGSLMGAVGCKDLGMGPAAEPSSDAQPDNSAPVSSDVLAEVTLADGSHIEFVEVAGNVAVTAEFDQDKANPLAMISEGTSNLTALYENLSGKPAPRALVDAEQHLSAGGDRSAAFGTPGPLVEQKSPASDPTISMTAAAFENLHCSTSGFCLTNRTGAVSATRNLAFSSRGAVDCVVGKVTAVYSERLLGQGPFVTRFAHDVRQGSTFLFVLFYLLPTDVRLSVSPAPTGRYHLSLK